MTDKSVLHILPVYASKWTFHSHWHIAFLPDSCAAVASLCPCSGNPDLYRCSTHQLRLQSSIASSLKCKGSVFLAVFSILFLIHGILLVHLFLFLVCLCSFVFSLLLISMLLFCFFSGASSQCSLDHWFSIFQITDGNIFSPFPSWYLTAICLETTQYFKETLDWNKKLLPHPTYTRTISLFVVNTMYYIY